MPEETKAVDVIDLPSAQHLALRIRDGWKIVAMAQIPGGVQFKLRPVQVATPERQAEPVPAEPDKPLTARLSKLRPKHGT